MIHLSLLAPNKHQKKKKKKQGQGSHFQIVFILEVVLIQGKNHSFYKPWLFSEVGWYGDGVNQSQNYNYLYTLISIITK